ncbi:toxin glutamine deamidase domain-containing protein [Streptomyces gibsoniae]|uniref:Toxin glutamine deamidase domain-containing protein n=1 Tax=Streptomyces gibsoniae TaxID=3075529 RepID=A0ABU2U5T2_9ACTN|nr:toxin glutamine deamidase domain-containing protein [Streptomyces sp. DSM 41699]MDT0468590.1 toxin glutamine deamidase domain-containing protein [Streptomyces sp. DSM 41699]
MTPVPIHTVTPAATPSAPPHASHAAPQPPGAPHAEPGTSPQHPHQESLDTIRNGLDHYPGGLTEPHPHDQQALVNAVPHDADGTPQRFPDPFGHWSQLQNDGGNQVPGRSNNCADCSRSFLETWYGNPQVSAPRTLDVDQHGNLDPWSPEHDANTNQIRWSGAGHTYAGTGSDPETPNRIASDLQQAGHGAAAIVQVDWPGGGGHAFNAVNHHGNIIWIDTQSGEVSHQPLHIPNAEHVWHIPLDANRNPLHPTPTPETGTSHHDSNNPQEGTGTPHPESDNSPHENNKASEPENSSDEPSKKTPDENTPHSDTETTPHNPPRTESDNHNGEDPSHAEPGPTHADTPKTDGPSTHHPSDTTHEPESGSPYTTDESKNRTESDGVRPPAHDAVQPSHAGTKTDETHPNAPHTSDPTPEHLPPSATERPGNVDARPITNDATHPASHAAPSAPTTDRDTPSATRHATTNEPSIAPSHRPPQEPTGQKPENGKKSVDSTEVTDTKKTSDHPYADPHSRGTSDTSGDSHSVTHDGPESDVSRTHEHPEGALSREYGIQPDALQQRLREQRDVHRVELDRVHHQLQRWTASGELAHVLQVTSGDRPHPGDPNGMRRFTRDQLSNHLDGFDRLSRGEQQAVVASLARLSLSFHQQHSVGRNPEPVTHPYRQPGESEPAPGTKDRGGKMSKQSLGVRLHRMAVNNLFRSAEFKKLPEDEAKAIRKNGPDFTDKNFAVLEVEGPPPHHEVTYIVDSSVPANTPGVSPRHSEKHLMDWLKRVDPDGTQYKPVGLYTEREPCGEGKGHARCSEVLLDKRLAGVPIHYSATYRQDPTGVHIRAAMIQDKTKALKTVDELSDQDVKQELERRTRERLIPNSPALPKNLKDISDLNAEAARRRLRSEVANEQDAIRKSTKTKEELAIVAEMNRHMEALDEIWGKLRPSLIN